MFRIAIGSDHAGLELKNQLLAYLMDANNFVIDKGTYTADSVDYPDFAFAVAKDVAYGSVQFGILVCKTGIGMSIAANKVRGARAAVIGSVENAVLAREHNDANILCLSAKDTDYENAKAIVDTFLNTAFMEGRHAIRVAKITTWENQGR